MSADTDLPKAISENTVELMGKQVRVYVLEDGRRILNAEDVAALMADLGELDPDGLRSALP